MSNYRCFVNDKNRLATLCCTFALGSFAFAADPHPEYTLSAPFVGTTNTFLRDLNHNVIHTWPSSFGPGASVYLIDNGAILRTAADFSVGNFGGGGRGGRIERIAWDGTVEWSYAVGGPDFVHHHDIELLPNGNILAIIWERYTAAEAIAMGRDPALVNNEVWSEGILEIEPVGATGGNIVWEWHVWDHLVQDFDPNLPNFGDPADFPGRVDINFNGGSDPDWLHWNGIDYNEALDQIVISSQRFSEVWVIPHDPNSDGNLLYRWGNPQAYGRGTSADQQLSGQHDPEWIPAGMPGAGNITIYNNGLIRGFGSMDEIETPLNPDGSYEIDAVAPFGPLAPIWSCDNIDGTTFFSQIMGGVQRLPNGNTLVSIAQQNDFVEVDENCDSVWSFDTGALAFRATRIDTRDPRLEGLLFGPLGDLNCDGLVTVSDIGPFVLALTDPAGYEAQFPACDILNADVNNDGFVTVGDIGLFVALLAGP